TTITCPIGHIASNGSVSFTVTVSIPTGFVGTSASASFDATGMVSGAGSIAFDSNSANDTKAANTVTVNAVANPQLTFVGSSFTAAPGNTTSVDSNIVLSINASNSGPDTAFSNTVVFT